MLNAPVSMVMRNSDHFNVSISLKFSAMLGNGHYSEVKYRAVRIRTVQFSAAKCREVKSSSFVLTALQCSAVKLGAL